MNKMLSASLLVSGLVFMIIGINGSNTLQSNDDWLLTGKPTPKARWMIYGGAGVAIVGLTMTLRGRKRAASK